MKKQVIGFLSHIVLLCACVALAASVMPRFPQGTALAAQCAAMLASPDVLVPRVKSKITDNIRPAPAHTTNARGGDAAAVYRAAGSEDGKDGRDLTATPADVAQLMKAEKSKYKKKNALGKTSEEPYFGGGNLVKYRGIEIQSKIPSSFYTPDIRSLLAQDSDLVIADKSKPTVLVYHSHTTEAYALLDKGFYIKSDARSENPKRNVVRVGDELVAELEAAGFTVIHDTAIHDREYNASYDESRRAVEKILEEYPSIEVTIDLHRDDITYKNKTKVKPTVKVNGKKAARMMLIAGCEYGKVRHFPDWEYNLRFDLQVQQRVNTLYGGLMRPILFSQRKYNMYETHNSFLLEVGTDANTLEEACYAARLFGRALASLMNEKYVRPA